MPPLNRHIDTANERQAVSLERESCMFEANFGAFVTGKVLSLPTCMHVFVHTHSCANGYFILRAVNLHAYIHTYRHTYMRAFLYRALHEEVNRRYMHQYIHMHIHTHIHF